LKDLRREWWNLGGEPGSSPEPTLRLPPACFRPKCQYCPYREYCANSEIPVGVTFLWRLGPKGEEEY